MSRHRRFMMIRRHRQSRVTILLVLVGIAVCALATEVSAADPITVRVLGTEGAEATLVEILAWEDESVVLVGITLPDGEYLEAALDAAVLSGSGLEDAYLDPDGWHTGRVFLPDSTGMAVYDVRFRPEADDESQVAFDFRPVDDPTRIAFGDIVFPPGSLPDPPVQTHAIRKIIRIINAVIGSCGRAQLKSIETCHGTARDVCSGSGGVKSAEFFGICGQGSCSVECYSN
jgi:hypothetical protein